MTEYVDLACQPQTGSAWIVSEAMDQCRNQICLANRHYGIVFDVLVKLTIPRHLDDGGMHITQLNNIVMHELRKWMRKRGLPLHCICRSDDSDPDVCVVRYMISVPPNARVAFSRMVQRMDFPYWASEVGVKSFEPDEISPLRQWLLFPELWAGHLPASLARDLDEASLDQLATALRVPRRPGIGAARLSAIPSALGGFALELTKFPLPLVDPAEPFKSFYPTQPFSDCEAERRQRELDVAAREVAGSPPKVWLKPQPGVPAEFDATSLIEKGEEA